MLNIIYEYMFNNYYILFQAFTISITDGFKDNAILQIFLFISLFTSTFSHCATALTLPAVTYNYFAFI